MKKDKKLKVAIDSRKQRNNSGKKGTNAYYGRVDTTDIKISGRWDNPLNMDIKTRPGLRIRPTTAIKKRKELMKSRNTRGYFHWILQIPEGVP